MCFISFAIRDSKAIKIKDKGNIPSLIIPGFSKKDFFFRVAFFTEIGEDRRDSFMWKKWKRVIFHDHCSWYLSHSFITTIDLYDYSHCINPLPHKNNHRVWSLGK